MNWMDVKTGLEVATGLSEDALHIYTAVILQLAAAAVSRRSVGDAFPWIFVFLAECGNEAADLYLAQAQDRFFMASLHDVINTMIMPSALFIIGRFAPTLIVRPQSRLVPPG